MWAYLEAEASLRTGPGNVALVHRGVLLQNGLRGAAAAAAGTGGLIRILGQNVGCHPELDSCLGR